MPSRRFQASSSLASSPVLLLFFSFLAHAAPPHIDSVIRSSERDGNPPGSDWTLPSKPGDSSRLLARAQRNTKYLPAQIGAVAAAYGLSLVLVAITLLILAKKRREHLLAGEEDLSLEDSGRLYSSDSFSAVSKFVAPHLGPRTPIRNFSYPSPIKTQFDDGQQLPPLRESEVNLSPISTTSGPGIDIAVDQTVVSADKEMAQSQLEEMYKHVFEHEDARQRGVVLDTPVMTAPSQRTPSSPASKKDRAKPANLNIHSPPSEETNQSRTESFFASLLSPRKKQQLKGTNISSPLMTPQSATFPKHEPREVSAIPHRIYHPLPPPPPPPPRIATEETAPRAQIRNSGRMSASNLSPQSTQSIDERMNSQMDALNTNSKMPITPSDDDPLSATSERSQATLVQSPSPPMRGAPFPSLPSSPKPGASFRRASPPSAVRTGGRLPLRAYEPAPGSPSFVSQTTKQTVFERKAPLSPMTGRSPMTAGAVPYTPYQPFTPLIPITPSLVTKEDRKRMKRMIPKTPTVEMVQSNEEVW